MSAPSKLSRVLEALASGRSFNRFQAERELHDHCLHSTVSRIESYGVPVFRQPETVPGYGGAPTRVMRYRILPDDQEQARRVLQELKRPAKKKPARARGLDRDPSGTSSHGDRGHVAQP